MGVEIYYKISKGTFIIILHRVMNLEFNMILRCCKCYFTTYEYWDCLNKKKQQV